MPAILSPLGALPRFLTTAEAAQVLRCAPATLTTWRVRGGGPRFRKIGAARRLVRYSLSDLVAFAEAAPSMRSTSDVAEGRAA